MDAKNQAPSSSAIPPALPLSRMARRSYAWMRWLTFAGVTVGCAFALRPDAALPGVPLLACLLAAYVGLVLFQYHRQRPDICGRLGMDAPRYLLISTLLIFGMMVAPDAATNGQSMWYGVAYFVVLGEAGRHLHTARALALLAAICMASITIAALIIVPSRSWPAVFLQFLPFYAGLMAAAAGSRTQRTQELEHAARLDLLRELERSKADAEEANRQLQIYAGTVEQLAVANERNRMARDLHDILGYTLATVVVKAEAAKRLLAADPGRALGELDRVQEVARGGLAEVRRSVSGLRDAAVVPGVWHEVITRFVEEFGQQGGLSITHHIDPLPEGHGADLEICLFRVIQEALTNVARHAQARQVSITLRVAQGSIDLAIEDDGVGVGPAASSASGFGLRGMRERVELLGGHLVFSSRRGSGARVLATLPLAPTEIRPCPPVDDPADPMGAAWQGVDPAHPDAQGVALAAGRSAQGGPAAQAAG